MTGGAGFIGANLVRALAGQPWCDRLTLIDDLSSGSLDNLASFDAGPLLEGSILDSALLDRALAGADAVVHLAARPSVARSVAEPVVSHEVNASGTVAVLEAMRRADVGHILVSSSSSVYGANPMLPKREDMVAMPVSPYAASKLAAESYALAWAAVYGLDVLAFRFFNVFGPLQAADHAYAAVVPAFLSAALDKRPLPLHGDGSQSRDFTFVGTVVDILVDALCRRVCLDRPVNLAFGSRVTLLELIARLEVILGRDLDVEHLPRRPGDVAASSADGTQLLKLFPDVQPVSLATGLAETLEWFQSRS